MTILQTGSKTSFSANDPWSFTHDQTINNGDLVVAILNVNGDGNPLDLPTGGTTWIEAYDADGAAADSFRTGIWYKKAGASEPSSYDFDTNVGNTASVQFRVFSGTFDTDPLDVAALANFPTSRTNPGCLTITVAVGAVAIAFCAADTATGTADSVDNSYTGLLSQSDRLTGSAYRIFASGGVTGETKITFSKTVLAATHHISFKESGGGGGAVVPIIMSIMNQFNGGS